MFNHQLYNTPYHDIDLSKHSFLITGGAGFIGSHLCKRLLNENHKVICLDNLFTGTLKNIEEFENNDNFEFVIFLF